MGNMIPVACAHPWFHQARRLEYAQACDAYAAPVKAPVVLWGHPQTQQ